MKDVKIFSRVGQGNTIASMEPEKQVIHEGREAEHVVNSALRFKTQAHSIRKYLLKIDKQEDCPGLAHVYDLRRHSITDLIEAIKDEVKDCPDFGDLPTLSGHKHVAGLTGLAEHCEHIAELLEAS